MTTPNRATNAQPERFERAVRAGCTDADIHLMCSYPGCGCRSTPRAIRAAIEDWERPYQEASAGDGERSTEGNDAAR